MASLYDKPSEGCKSQAYRRNGNFHPCGKALPSADDHDAVLYIEQLLKNLDCKLIDSFIVGKDGIYSEKQSSYARIFATTDQITNIANQ